MPNSLRMRLHNRIVELKMMDPNDPLADLLQEAAERINHLEYHNAELQISNNNYLLRARKAEEQYWELKKVSA